ncbi:MAG: carboxymuconolactone decarboxylase family protein, partial [Achromobacter spanius]
MHTLTDLDAIKSRFIAARGYWRPWTETMLRANPAFLSYYADYAGYPARTGPLTPRMVELVYVALDASATHLYAAGL